MAYINPLISTVDIQQQDSVTHLISFGTVIGTPPAGATYANLFALDCVLQDINGAGVYQMSGSVAVPAWTLIGTLDALATNKIFIGSAGGTAAAQTMSGDATIVANGTLTIANSAVTLAKLASGITPSHVVKYGGKITWSGSGASLATTVTGVASTDIVVATIQTAPTQAAYLVSAAPTTDTVTVTLSAANTSNDAVIAYTVFRAAA